MSDTPIIPAEYLEYLERLYQPRCKRPGEDEENHQRYAGKVELISHMRLDAEAAHSKGEDDHNVFQSETT